MIESQRKFAKWCELDLPEVVYKYRCWNDESHKTIISKCQVFMSPQIGFEDPVDFKYYFDMI